MGCVRRSAHRGVSLLSALFASSERSGEGEGEREREREREREGESSADKTRIATHTLSSALKCSCELATGLFQACNVFTNALHFNDVWLF